MNDCERDETMKAEEKTGVNAAYKLAGELANLINGTNAADGYARQSHRRRIITSQPNDMPCVRGLIVPAYTWAGNMPTHADPVISVSIEHLTPDQAREIITLVRTQQSDGARRRLGYEHEKYIDHLTEEVTNPKSKTYLIPAMAAYLRATYPSLSRLDALNITAEYWRQLPADG